MKTLLKFAFSSIFLFTAIIFASSFSSQKALAIIDNGGTGGSSCKEKPTFTMLNNIKENGYRTYILKLVNNNPASCGASKFSHEIPAGNLPSGWGLSFNPAGNYVSVTPGVPATFTMNVTPAANATAKTYDFNLISADINVVSPPIAKVALSYTVDSSSNLTCNEQPSLILVSTVKGNGSNTYNLKLKNNNAASCGTAKFNHEILAGQLPTGWGLAFTPSGTSISVAPGTPATFAMKVTPTANAASKTYSFTLSSANINITSPKSDKVALSYTIGGSGTTSECKKAPSVDINPSTLSGKPGDSKTADVKVTNQNSTNCSASDFTISHNDIGTKWTATFDNNATVKALKPGKSATVKVTVKPNKSVANGSSKQITVYAKSGNKAAGSAIVTYSVSGGGGTGGTTATNTPTPGGGGGNGGNTKLAVTIGIDGMGTTPRIPIGGNQNPIDGYSSRPLTFKIYNTSNNSLALSTDQSLSYNNSDKRFHATFSLPDSFATGTYNVYAAGLPYIVAQYPGSKTITKNQTSALDSANFNMITGNINDKDQSQNKIDLLDYNVMISCWIYSTNTNACDQDPDYIANSDLNGDGQVDQDDYTLLLKEMANQQGATLPDQ